jgi:hypothetical protein
VLGKCLLSTPSHALRSRMVTALSRSGHSQVSSSADPQG